MDAALKQLEKEFKTTITEYTICAKRGEDGEFYHYWYIGSDLSSPNNNEIASYLDNCLKEANKNYKVARTKALKGVKVEVVPAELFHEWNGKNKKKGGQVKMERVMNEEKFSAFETFISSQS